MNSKLRILNDCSTSLVHDLLRDSGLEDFTLPNRITALLPSKTICGPAFTFDGEIVSGASKKEVISRWMRLLDCCLPGQIWTSQPNSHEVAQMGGLSAQILMSKGVLGCIIDGALRDSDEIIKLGFPCWRICHTPRDIFDGFLPSNHNIPIKIGDVLIEPGDWLHADLDGIVRIPLRHLDDIVAQATDAKNNEKKIQASISAGVDPLTAYQTFKN